MSESEDWRGEKSGSTQWGFFVFRRSEVVGVAERSEFPSVADRGEIAEERAAAAAAAGRAAVAEAAVVAVEVAAFKGFL